MNKEPLKLGKISRPIEDAFHLAFASDISIYLMQTFIEGIIERKPDNYLSTIEEMKEIIRDPDIVYYSDSALTFIYFRLYSSSKGFKIVGIRVSLMGRPKKWQIVTLKSYNDKDCVGLLQNGEFRRIAKPRVGKKKKSI